MNDPSLIRSATAPEMIVAAARKYDRKVQMGNQRRSRPSYTEAMQRLREGVIGTLRASRCFYNNRRGSLGRGKAVAHIRLKKTPSRVKEMILVNPPRIVFDLVFPESDLAAARAAAARRGRGRSGNRGTT